MSEGYQPTEAEIRAKCLEIQAEWSDKERQQRAPYFISPASIARWHGRGAKREARESGE